MRRPQPKQLRVRSVGTKLTEAEYTQCEWMAARCGLSVNLTVIDHVLGWGSRSYKA
jgi:hypothetical protein